MDCIISPSFAKASSGKISDYLNTYTHILVHTPSRPATSSTMSSHQDSYHYSDPSFYYESGSGPPITRQSYSPESRWTSSPTTVNPCDYPDPRHSLDQAGTQLEAFGTEASYHNPDTPSTYASHLSGLEDARYPYSYRHSYSPEGSSLQTDATIIDNPHPLSNLPFYPHPDFDYGHTQPRGSYPTHEPGHDFRGQHMIDNTHATSDFTQSFPQPQEIIIPQAEGPSAAVYLGSSSTELLPLDHGIPAYVADAMPVRPTEWNPAFHVASTGSAEPASADAGMHSHPSPVASSSNHNFAAGPSRPLPSSPDKKRPFQFTADEEPHTTRRVLPRFDRGTHSRSPDSHRRGHGANIHGRGPEIPQERYTTSSVSIYNPPTQQLNISFDLENPNQSGIPIIDVLNGTGTFDRMRDRLQEFNMGKKTFTLRVQWPGYRLKSKTIAAKNWKKERGPLTRAKLATAVATAVRDMLQKMRDEPYDSSYAKWNVGPNGIQFDQLCLVALLQVSRGSWQPQLCLLQPHQQ